ncbi:protein CSN12 [Fusarium oxysporum f. sp. lycopersici 4287]|uniref:Protein CSN12 homolog n=1 Tax=Fusarium oxysporum f. sp. lycopersici (strain 4287 / CBS 123668 / FGSC 9935 / NRRL 34936) TaxID=426428 RepID=A0A0J9VJI4_FUSO4|nr:protein CSN12 [Fusarium oxysporum f. sp. lycopersici 4287]KNB11208.1 protein CSN12 [Fusarium oxysporum f. sp. lycopersici 4287]
MNTLFDQFAEAHSQKNGYKLAQTLSPVAPPDDPHRLMAVWRSTNSHSVKGDIKHFIKSSTSHRRKMSHDETTGWVEVYTSYWKAIAEILAGESGKSTWTKVYEAWKELTSVLIRGYNSHGFEAWTIPSLYMVGKYLRLFAIKSDEERQAKTFDTGPGASLISDDFDPETDKQLQLRDCEGHLKRIFSLCLNDRAPLEESRKWGIYFVINLLFKTYFKLNSASLSRTILKTLAVYNDKGDMPPLEMFPKSQRVTFKFYEGVLLFLEENYNKAESHLNEAWQLCHKDALRQSERQNTIRTRIKSGNLQAFDKALQDGEAEFVKRRIYLTLERGRDIALRNLLRKVFIAGGFDEPKEGETTPVRRTRIPVAEFQAAVSMGSGHMVDPDEVECMLANMIYKELMKGYIARERGIVVLSKKGAFPGTGL